MYGIHRVAAELSVVTLAPSHGVGLPFGYPYNVYVLHGRSVALVGTGMRGAREALLAALDELGVEPSAVARVLLTSRLPEATGNVELFERASVHAVAQPRSDRPPPASVAERVVVIASELLEGDEGHPEWSGGEIAAFAAAYMESAAPETCPAGVRDGERCVAGALELEAIATPGVDPVAGCWFEPSRGWLFGGETLVLAQDPRIQVASDYIDSLARLSRHTPELILPAHGGVERGYKIFFRSLSLSVNNLLTNLPFALQGPRSAAHVAYNDLGYWPRDLIRFAAFVDRYQVMLDELERGGVAARDGEGAWAPYTMDRPARF